MLDAVPVPAAQELPPGGCVGRVGTTAAQSRPDGVDVRIGREDGAGGGGVLGVRLRGPEGGHRRVESHDLLGLPRAHDRGRDETRRRADRRQTGSGPPRPATRGGPSRVLRPLAHDPRPDS